MTRNFDVLGVSTGESSGSSTISSRSEASIGDGGLFGSGLSSSENLKKRSSSLSGE